MKYLYMMTSGDEVPTRASLPFQLATAAALLGNDSTLVLTATGVRLAKKGLADELTIAHEMPKLRHFLDLAKEAGVQLLVCSGGFDVTGLKPDDLIPEVDGIIGGVTFNEMAAEADVVLVF